VTDRTITLGTTEAEKFAALAVGESMWIVREGVRQYVGLKPMPASPPVEFVQACAPCETWWSSQGCCMGLDTTQERPQDQRAVA